ncbi:MAG: PEP/pyruvate-binding domain-containing protein [Fidelibacterota bacterium]|nr:MAG: PEP/pyruvate-binding domain-containing protein [Candidatus Neomarinimicrobiota bacterium]
MSASRKTNQCNSRPSSQEIRAKIRAYPHLEEKVYLQLLLHLHEKRYVAIDDIYELARKEVKTFQYDHDPGSPNVGPDQWSSNERRLIRRLTLKYACEYLSEKEIDELIFSVVKRDYVYALENIANLTDVSFGVVADKVREFCRIPSMTPLPKEEVLGLRVSLLRHFISEHLEYIRIAKHYITIRDMEPVVDNTLGSAAGHGRIGGKAAGMLLGYKIIQSTLGDKYGDLIRIPQSHYLRTDVFEDFLSLNGLTKYQHQKYKSPEEIRNEYPAIQEVFRNGQFPDYIVKQCRAMLKKLGKHPIIVRSSSLLEDNFKAAFSGKYQSVFLGNQGSLDQRLSQLLAAIGEVFASGIAPDPLMYRRERNLLDYDEKIGILIQRVVGFKYSHYFLPAYAGVALSRNDYTWSPRIREEDGLMRIVMGLGTRAVDRVGDDYPRLVALSAPSLRPESNLEEQKRYSQTHVDVINLQTNSYEIIHLGDLWCNERMPEAEKIISLEEDGYLQAPYTDVPPAHYPKGVVTFSNLMGNTPFPGIMRNVLSVLEEAYECPIDIEFSHDGHHLYLLQTRPMAQRVAEEAVVIPRNIPLQDQIFSTQRYVRNGQVDNVEYIIYCDPRAYHQITDDPTRHQLARLIGTLNQRMVGKKFILMGPGRWGSNNINLGIPVQYSEINNTKVLIEIAHRESDYTPEVSFGTHFFLDLVEKGIHYLPLFPDESDNSFQQEFFSETPNALGSLSSESTQLEPYIKVIDVRQALKGRLLHLRMDGQHNLALAYVDDGT